MLFMLFMVNAFPSLFPFFYPECRLAVVHPPEGKNTFPAMGTGNKMMGGEADRPIF